MEFKQLNLKNTKPTGFPPFEKLFLEFIFYWINQMGIQLCNWLATFISFQHVNIRVHVILSQNILPELSIIKSLIKYGSEYTY